MTGGDKPSKQKIPEPDPPVAVLEPIAIEEAKKRVGVGRGAGRGRRGGGRQSQIFAGRLTQRNRGNDLKQILG